MISLSRRRVIDPSIGLDAIRDVAIVAGKIAGVDADITGDAADTIDAAARSSPGLIDIHTMLPVCAESVWRAVPLHAIAIVVIGLKARLTSNIAGTTISRGCGARKK